MEYKAANKIFHKIKSYIKENYKCRVKKVGSLRRKCPIVNDIDFESVSYNSDNITWLSATVDRIDF